MSESRVVWMNGEFVPEHEAKLSIYDSALMFGDMVFEMTRSFNGEQFKLTEHLERLYIGLKILRIPIEIEPAELESVVHETVTHNQAAFADDDEHRILIDVSRGLLGIYEGVKGLAPGPNVIVADFPLRWTVSGMGRLFDSGISAVIPAQRAIPAQLLDPKIKNRSRVHYLKANIEVSAIGDDNSWALLLDTDGFIAEGTGDNFFAVKGGKLFTPRGHNILRGVSRRYIIEELAGQVGLEAVEADLEPYDVHSADEAFMTGTPFCMLPVTRLNGLPIGNGEVGEAFTKLIAQWGDNVGVDIAAQIKDWDSQAAAGPVEGATPYRFGS